MIARQINHRVKLLLLFLSIVILTHAVVWHPHSKDHKSIKTVVNEDISWVSDSSFPLITECNGNCENNLQDIGHCHHWSNISFSKDSSKLLLSFFLFIQTLYFFITFLFVRKRNLWIIPISIGEKRQRHCTFLLRGPPILSI